MPNGHQIDVKKLEENVSALLKALSDLGSPKDLTDLLVILRHPGWTTPAEFVFANGIVNSMLGHAAVLAKLRTDLLQGSRAVTGST